MLGHYYQKAVIEDFKMKSKGVILISTNLDIRNIKAMFNKMIEFELLDYSRISYVKQFKIEKKKMLAIDSADIVKLLNSLKNIQIKPIVRFTLLTVSRVSEVLKIKIKDIDFENEVINIFQQKTNCFKTIPLGLFELITEIINYGNEKNILTLVNKESYLFHYRTKNFTKMKLRANTVSKQFKKILKKLKLSNVFKFHSLRHSSITELLKNNVPLNAVKDVAEQKSITTTMIYSHVRSTDMKEAVNSLNY